MCGGSGNGARLTVGQPLSRTQVCTTQPDHRAFALNGSLLLKRFPITQLYGITAHGDQGHCSRKSAAIRFGSTGGLNPNLRIAITCDRLDQTTQHFSGAHFNEGICPLRKHRLDHFLEENRTSDLVGKKRSAAGFISGVGSCRGIGKDR